MIRLVFLALTLCLLSPVVFAQNAAKPDSFASNATAQDANTLIMGRYTVRLWGVEAARLSGTKLSLKGRTAMDDLIGDDAVSCSVVVWRGEQPIARCANKNNIDLAASMLQQGYAVVERQAVTGTVYEEPYFTAEKTAR